MRKKFLLAAVALLLASFLSGCGGSSSSQQEPLKGIYKDAGVVSGLQYRTATQSGVTDADGAFLYMPGETVTFSVSNVTIGQAAGAATLTTFDLVGIAPPLTSFGIPLNNPNSNKFQEAVNISLFLQTLDADSNPANGISIPAAVNSVNANTPINFKIYRSDVSWIDGNDFGSSPQFKTFIGSCRSAGIWGGIKAVRIEPVAANNLYRGLGIAPSVYVKSKTTSSDQSFTSWEYAASGLVSKESYYNSANVLTGYTVYTYDENGRQTNSEFTSLIDPLTNHTVSNVYDSNGNNITYDKYVDYLGVTLSQTDQQFDINGNVTRSETVLGGSLYEYRLYTYNANGTRSRAEQYDPSNLLTGTTLYTYNQNLLLTAIQDQNPLGTSLTLTYDQNQRLINESVFTGNVLDLSGTVTYDSFGNPSVISYDSPRRSLQSSQSYTWNENGFLIAATRTSPSDPTLSFSTSYNYDSNGSLVSIVTTENGSSYTSTSSYINQSGWGYLFNWYWYGSNG